MMPASLVEVTAQLRDILAAEDLITDADALGPFECDALTMYKRRPRCVALPRSVSELIAVVKVCAAARVPVVTRGAGTGLSGGALPHADGVLLVTSKLNHIVQIDASAGTATVEPGVRNLAISQAVARHGLFYGPDPSSQVACTIGGNVAENSGGVRCLKYGLTGHNVVQAKYVAADGDVLTVGGPAHTGYNLLALLHGSEGMLGIVVEVTLALAPLPEAKATILCAFDSHAAGGSAVAQIIEAGIIPAGLEVMDGLAVEVVEEFLQLGYPQGAQLVMICETDGYREDATAQMDKVKQICLANGARDWRMAEDETERERLWLGRKSALPAVGRRASDYYCIDGTIPRRSLGAVLEQITALGRKYELPCANVFHAGDGNLHPLIMFDAGSADESARAREYGSEVLRACLAVGGTITGEHGVGVEKINEMCLQFSTEELDTFHRLKQAFDPDDILNPGKAIPTLQRCAEFGMMHVSGGKLPHPELDRF